MNRKLLRRYPWAVYGIVFLSAIIMFLLGIRLEDNNNYKDLLLSLSSNFFAVSLIFFIVDQIFLWRPEEDREKAAKSLINNVQKLLERGNSSDIKIYPTKDDMYSFERSLLNTKHWEKIRVFAPVELWRQYEDKKQSFSFLANSVRTGKVDAIWAVFGLPPTTDKGIARNREQILSDLHYVKGILNLFNDAKHMTIHFLPPSHVAIGLATIIFEDLEGSGEVAFGLATHEHEAVVDTGFSTSNSQLFATTRKWFDEQIFHKATRTFILQDDGAKFEELWDEVVRAWYGEDYLEID